MTHKPSSTYERHTLLNLHPYLKVITLLPYLRVLIDYFQLRWHKHEEKHNS